ncbi:hypothetical protein [Blastochloris viridis]|uniref:hypothetical protein n=1 Tax=Blastochloris viridis TaxID=1079 RepID=UPI001F2B9DAF|nr:hypothetical protein [Blastochloris viridis]
MWHSLATGLLRKGASLDEIGDVLRHRSRATTAFYAQRALPQMLAGERHLDRRLALADPVERGIVRPRRPSRDR